jgi:RimJ/RimL family protein N-acetyltransferase
MKWRNEQIYHLRQSMPLTEKMQTNYFENVIKPQFNQVNPNQILFSFLVDNVCVGYGGMVHINWIDKNAEISFLMNTELEKVYFEEFWLGYLKLIEKVAFEELSMHKIFVYAFDLRPHLYIALEKGGFFKDAVLKEHCYFHEKFIDVVIYSKLKKN